ncbi:energy transducer TonB [Pontibacter sp. SGAir0037]|uniref:energy transducer TonB n=1 Tax=Pontibacter sp. SGAir0037 TaxID=2571030 RepID=UPI0010CD030F|nr:energy transducer TonB [Pontibacter sp. SGAir0037]QCR21055.1 hypothetical protein C1N53_00850 [Pontibacter sp. SGAir0037]
MFFFTVHEDGSLTDITIVKDLGYGTAEEAVRVTELMANMWQPGGQNGITVPVRYTLPVRFALD